MDPDRIVRAREQVVALASVKNILLKSSLTILEKDRGKDVKRAGE